MAKTGYTAVSIDQNYLTMLDGDAYRWVDFQTLPSSGTKEYLILTSSAPFDLFFYGRVFAGRTTNMNLQVFINPTFTSEGTAMPDRIFNRNGTSEKRPTTQIWQDPTITSDGSLTDYDILAGAKGPAQGSSGSVSSQEFPRIFPRDQYLLVRITNTSSAEAGSYVYKIFWSEVRNGTT